MSILDLIPGKSALLAHSAAPTVLFGAGVVGVVGSTVLACRATLKLEDLLDSARRDLDVAKTLEHDDYSDEDRKRDITLIYVRSAASVAKLYAPAVILGGAAILSLTTSHNLLQQRIVGLTAAYTALEKGFSQYRERVVDKYGADQDRDFRYGVEKVKIKDPETGKERTVSVVPIDRTPSIYARFFDESSGAWEPYPEYNHTFLMGQQAYANDRLVSRGHVFLNEVYESIGIPHSEAGAVVGWVLNGDHSDNYIDFGIFDHNNERARDFVNGREGVILLDFNVDGVIIGKNKIDKKGTHNVIAE